MCQHSISIVETFAVHCTMPRQSVTTVARASPVTPSVSRDVVSPTPCVDDGHVKRSTPVAAPPPPHPKLPLLQPVLRLVKRVVLLLVVLLLLNVVQG